MKDKTPAHVARSADRLNDAVVAGHEHWQATGHSTRTVLVPDIRNRETAPGWDKKYTKFTPLTYGGRGYFGAECRQGCRI